VSNAKDKTKVIKNDEYSINEKNHDAWKSKQDK